VDQDPASFEEVVIFYRDLVVASFLLAQFLEALAEATAKHIVEKLVEEL